MTTKVKAIHDLSFYPESHMVAHALEDGIAFGKKHVREIGELVDIADLSLISFPKAERKLSTAMRSENPWKRYWACIGATLHGKKAKTLVPVAKKLLEDKNLMVRVRAAEFLGTLKASDPMPTLLKVVNQSTSPQEVLLAFNAVVYLRDFCGYAFDSSKVALKVKAGESARRIDYLSGKAKL